MKVTADTITDEQIRELAQAYAESTCRELTAGPLPAICIARGDLESALRSAFLRCAEILNARKAVKP